MWSIPNDARNKRGNRDDSCAFSFDVVSLLLRFLELYFIFEKKSEKQYEYLDEALLLLSAFDVATTTIISTSMLNDNK